MPLPIPCFLQFLRWRGHLRQLEWLLLNWIDICILIYFFLQFWPEIIFLTSAGCLFPATTSIQISVPISCFFVQKMLYFTPPHWWVIGYTFWSKKGGTKLVFFGTFICSIFLTAHFLGAFLTVILAVKVSSGFYSSAKNHLWYRMYVIHMPQEISEEQFIYVFLALFNCFWYCQLLRKQLILEEIFLDSI